MTTVCNEHGTGRTTTVAAVASSLAMLGHKVLCICFEADARELERVLCIDVPADTYYLDDPPEMENLIDVTFEHMKIEDLFYLNVQSKCAPEKLRDEDIASFFAMIRREFDFCIIDTQAEMCAVSKLAQANADVSLIVATDEKSSLDMARQLANEIRDTGIEDVELLINKINPERFKIHWENVEKELETIDATLIGVVLEDKNISRAISEHTPLILFRKKLAIYDFFDTARRLMGETIRWPFRSRQAKITSISIKGISTTHAGSYGDPKTWAMSTLIGKVEKLVKIFEILPGADVALEDIRKRTWIHELLDAEGIKYKVDISGSWITQKKYSLTHSILVEPKNRDRAKELIPEESNIPKPYLEDEYEEEYNVELMQKTCPSCGSEIDFDYYKCPICKAKV